MAVPGARIDWPPLLLAPFIALLSLALISSVDTWLTLTIGGLAMGMIIFLIASGLTVVFGMMDVFNFGHGLFIALGAYVAFTVLGLLPAWALVDNLLLNLLVMGLTLAGAMAVAALFGWIFERTLIKKVHGKPLLQILVTMGGMVVGEELLKAAWGAELKTFLLPAGLRGSLILGGAAVEKYRILAALVGLAVFALLMLVLTRTKAGMLMRAGVQDREMVEAFGYPIRNLFVGVFVAGSALAGLGGAMWGMYQQVLFPQMGTNMNVLVFIVIIIGGLGSVGGSFIAALLVGLLANYIGFLSLKLSLVANILLLLAILAWRPNGLYQITSR